MIKKIINKKHIINSLLNFVDKKGKLNTSKSLLLESSTKISKNNYNDYFTDLFYNIIMDVFIPFDKKKSKNKYKNIYIKNFKSISNNLINLINNIKKNKKRISFDFYFKNEIYKLLNDSSNLYTFKLDKLILFNNINNNYQNINYNFNIDFNISDCVYKKYITTYNYNYVTNNFYCLKIVTRYINKKLKQKINIINKPYKTVYSLSNIIKTI